MCKRQKSKRAKQVVVNKSGLSVDNIICQLEKQKTVLKEAKLHYEEKLVDQINVNDERFWNYTRHFTKSSSTIIDLNFEGKNFSDDQTKANILNNYFISVLMDEPQLTALSNNFRYRCKMYTIQFRNFTHFHLEISPISPSMDQVNKTKPD